MSVWQKNRDSLNELGKGICVLLTIAFTWTSLVQFVKSALTTSSLSAPFFLTVFNTSWMITCYPLYLAGYLIVRRRNYCYSPSNSADQVEPVFEIVKKDALFRVFNADGSQTFSLSYIIRCLSKIGLFAAAWCVANYAYYEALVRITVTEAAVVSSSNLGIVYVLSIVLLKEHFAIAKILALFLSVVGIILVSYAQGFGSFAYHGVILALVSAFAAAVYKVALKMVVGAAALGEVSFFLTLLGCMNVILFTPILLGVILGGAQEIDWANAPWGMMLTSAFLGLSFNFAVNFGIALTNPLFISIGMFSGIPLNGLVDWYWRGAQFSWWQLSGCILLLCSFILLLLPPSLACQLNLSPDEDVLSDNLQASHPCDSKPVDTTELETFIEYDPTTKTTS